MYNIIYIFAYTDKHNIYIMAVLKIYNDIQTENEQKLCQFWGDAEGVTFKDVDEFVNTIADDDNNIEIRLHCDGGSVLEGWAIYDKIRATGKDITTIVEGNVASMATVIMMAAPIERRKAYGSAQILVHNPWIYGSAVGDYVTADELQKAADSLKQQQDKILNLYVERCGCDRDEMQALMNEDKFIDVNRAKELGLISEIIAPASAKVKGVKFNNYNNKKKMAKNNATAKADEKVEVKASILNKVLAKLGVKSIEEAAKGMDLSTSDGQTLTVERDEGEPQIGDNASPDGTFEMPDGKTIVVEGGVITDIKTADPNEGGSGGSGDGTDDETESKIADLENKVSDLEAENEDLKKQLNESQSNAKTKDDLRILNAVKIAGGEKALAKISSTFKPAARVVVGGNASSKANEQGESPMRAEIEARRNGTYGKK